MSGRLAAIWCRGAAISAARRSAAPISPRSELCGPKPEPRPEPAKAARDDPLSVAGRHPMIRPVDQADIGDNLALPCGLPLDTKQRVTGMAVQQHRLFRIGGCG